MLYLPSSLGSYNISLLGNEVLRTGILSPVNTDSLNIAYPFKIIASHGIVILSSITNMSPGTKSSELIYCTLFSIFILTGMEYLESSYNLLKLNLYSLNVTTIESSDVNRITDAYLM